MLFLQLHSSAKTKVSAQRYDRALNGLRNSACAASERRRDPMSTWWDVRRYHGNVTGDLSHAITPG